jgi:peptidoglycan/xylan/chitin deacetylase (PgdA/CDA1 family)
MTSPDPAAVPGPPRDHVGYGRVTPEVAWPDGAAVALSIVVNHEEGSEYSLPAGDGRNEDVGEVPWAVPPDRRDLHVESVFEYGSRAGIWRLLRLFEEYGVNTTFFAAAVALERNPEVGAVAREHGHELCSHGWRWEEHWNLERDEERQHIQWAIEAFERLYGERPLGWFCRFAPSVNTRELLVEEGGFLYDCDAFNDDLPYFTEVHGKRHLVLPYTDVYNDSRFVLSQGFSSPRDFVELVTRALGELLREGRAGHGKMMSVGLHPRWAGQPGRTSAVREIIEWALEQGDVWIARRRDIAQWWVDQHQAVE